MSMILNGADTGPYAVPVAQLDALAIWTRALTREQVSRQLHLLETSSRAMCFLLGLIDT